MKQISLMVLVLILSLSAYAETPHLKVGALLSLTGPLSWLGQDTADGMALCAEDKVSVVFEDHRSQPQAAVAAFQKLLAYDGATFVVANLTSVAQALIPIAQSRGVPLLLTTVSSGEVAKRGGLNVANLFTTAEQDGPIVADALARHFQYKSAGILFLEGDFGLSYADAFGKRFVEDGGVVTFRDSYIGTTGDFRAQLTKIKAVNPDALFVIGYDSHLQAIVRQAREIGLKSRLASNWLMSAPPLRKGNEQAYEGVICTSPLFYLEQTEEARRFSGQFTARFHRDPTVYAAIGCDIGRVLAEHASESPTSVMKSIRSMNNVPGITGSLTANQEGIVRFPLIPVEIKGGMLERNSGAL